MKRLTTGALALVLLASAGSAALAQEGGRRSRADIYNGRNADQPQAQPDAAPPAPANRGHGRDGSPVVEDRSGDRGHARDGSPRGDDRRADGDRRGGGDRNWQGERERQGDRNWQGDRNRQGDQGDRNWRRGGDQPNWRDGRGDERRWQPNRGDDRRHYDRPRYDRRAYPNTWRPEQRFRGYDYRAPPGFYSRRWRYGEVLPRGWWGPDYRLDAWWDFGLPVPPIGYEWVRVGDDALLVDMYTGRVVQVAYDLFW